MVPSGEGEIKKTVLESDLAKPVIVNGVDISLMTIKELLVEAENVAEHEKIVRKRADELSFYPDTLSEEERVATLKCLSYEELRPFYKAGALYEKNHRLQKNLSLEEKIDVRIYVLLSTHFSEYGPAFRRDPDDVDVGLFTKRYFEIMKKHGEEVYEEPFYFVDEKRKKRALIAYAKLDAKNS